MEKTKQELLKERKERTKKKKQEQTIEEEKQYAIYVRYIGDRKSKVWGRKNGYPVVQKEKTNALNKAKEIALLASQSGFRGYVYVVEFPTMVEDFNNYKFEVVKIFEMEKK
jgi:hypothetical protein